MHCLLLSVLWASGNCASEAQPSSGLTLAYQYYHTLLPVLVNSHRLHTHHQLPVQAAHSLHTSDHRLHTHHIHTPHHRMLKHHNLSLQAAHEMAEKLEQAQLQHSAAYNAVTRSEEPHTPLEQVHHLHLLSLVMIGQ